MDEYVLRVRARANKPEGAEATRRDDGWLCSTTWTALIARTRGRVSSVVSRLHTAVCHLSAVSLFKPVFLACGSTVLPFPFLLEFIITLWSGVHGERHAHTNATVSRTRLAAGHASQHTATRKLQTLSDGRVRPSRAGRHAQHRPRSACRTTRRRTRGAAK